MLNRICNSSNILLIILLVVLTPHCIHAQTGGHVLDKTTKKPVAFANIWIKNENFGTTTDINGLFNFKFDLRNKLVIISSIGYEQLEAKIDTTNPILFLTPKIYTIPEIDIKPHKVIEETWATYKKSQIRTYDLSNEPVIYATYLPYQGEDGESVFIKSIKIETWSKINSCFNLRFLKVLTNGSPGDDILSENMIINVKKGRRSCIVDDLVAKKISIPKEGIFIAFEFLIIKENEYSIKAMIIQTKRKEHVLVYMPGFGVKFDKNSSPIWIYSKGRWEQLLGKTLLGAILKDKNECIAIEVKVTN